MQFNPSKPLVAMLNTDAAAVSDWQRAAFDACRESVALLDSMTLTSQRTDQDVQVCLEAVRNSLTWVLSEPVSDRQVQLTMARAVKIFQSVEHAELA